VSLKRRSLVTVGQEIRRQREAKGWSQAKLGVLAGTGPSGISQIETGRRNPSAATLQRIAEALGVEVRDLFPLEQAPLPDFKVQRGFNAWAVSREEYRRLRNAISRFENLPPAHREPVFEEALQLLQSLREAYGSDHDPANSELGWELGLLHDALHEAVLRMVAVCELEQERGDAGADIIDIEKYKARVAEVA
jgi:transcriptional regulator with XRE-family HTH domain